MRHYKISQHATLSKKRKTDEKAQSSQVYYGSNMAVISNTIRIVWALVFTSESFIITVTNILALRIFLSKKFPKSAILLANLTIADALSGITPLMNGIEAVYSIEGKYQYCSRTMNVITLNLSHFFNLASLSALTVIAVERAISVFLPMKHHKAKRWYFICGSIYSWIQPSVLFLYGVLAECGPTYSEVIRSFLKFLVIPSVCITVVSYAAVLIKIRFFPFHVFSVFSRIHSRLSRTLIIASTLTLIAVLPKMVVMALRQNCEACKNMPVHVVMAVDCILYSSSFFHILVYAFRIPVFRKEMMKRHLNKCSSL